MQAGTVDGGNYFYREFTGGGWWRILKSSDTIPTWQKHLNWQQKKKRARTHGFLKRVATRLGRKLLGRRRAKGRARLTV